MEELDREYPEYGLLSIKDIRRLPITGPWRSMVLHPYIAGPSGWQPRNSWHWRGPRMVKRVEDPGTHSR